MGVARYPKGASRKKYTVEFEEKRLEDSEIVAETLTKVAFSIEESDFVSHQGLILPALLEQLPPTNESKIVADLVRLLTRRLERIGRSKSDLEHDLAEVDRVLDAAVAAVTRAQARAILSRLYAKWSATDPTGQPRARHRICPDDPDLRVSGSQWFHATHVNLRHYSGSLLEFYNTASSGLRAIREETNQASRESAHARFEQEIEVRLNDLQEAQQTLDEDKLGVSASTGLSIPQLRRVVRAEGEMSLTGSLESSAHQQKASHVQHAASERHTARQTSSETKNSTTGTSHESLESLVLGELRRIFIETATAETSLTERSKDVVETRSLSQCNGYIYGLLETLKDQALGVGHGLERFDDGNLIPSGG